MRRGWPGSFAAIVVLVAGCATSTPRAQSPTATHSGSVARTAPITTIPRTTTTAGDDEGPIDPHARTALPAVGSPATTSSTLCRSGAPLANVYHPSRLQVIHDCVTILGTVMSVRREDDGDVHFDLQVDRSFVNAGNVARQHGWLVIEIVPADEPGCTVGKPPRAASGTYDYGTCTGANVSTPAIGAHVAVTGPYVLDRNHGWMEVHPAWSINGANTTIDTAPRVTSPTQTTPSTVGGVYYANCSAARAAGAAPIYRGQPGYQPALDRDGDGIACE